MADPPKSRSVSFGRESAALELEEKLKALTRSVQSGSHVGKVQASRTILVPSGSRLEVEKAKFELKSARQGFTYTKSESSIFPSYSNLELPYRVICRQRYRQCIKDQQKQFLKELQMHEELQPMALNGAKIHREFANPILKKVCSKDIIKLTVEEDRKLEYLLKTRAEDLK